MTTQGGRGGGPGTNGNFPHNENVLEKSRNDNLTQKDGNDENHEIQNGKLTQNEKRKKNKRKCVKMLWIMLLKGLLT